MQTIRNNSIQLADNVTIGEKTRKITQEKINIKEKTKTIRIKNL